MSTPIPESVMQMAAIGLLLMAAAPMVTAAFLHALLARRLRCSPTGVYAGVLALLCGALLAWPGSAALLLPQSEGLALAAMLVAPLTGWAAFHLDLQVVRRKRRREAAVAVAARQAEPVRRVTAQSPWVRAGALSASADARERVAPQLQVAEAVPRDPPWLHVLVGMLEEVGFRALLVVGLSWLAPAPGLAGWAAVACLWFCLAHATTNAMQALAKLPLSLLATLLLLAGGPLPAMLVHGTFNSLVVAWLRRAGRPA